MKRGPKYNPLFDFQTGEVRDYHPSKEGVPCCPWCGVEFYVRGSANDVTAGMACPHCGHRVRQVPKEDVEAIKKRAEKLV